MAKLPHVKAASPSMRIFQPQFGVGTSDVRHSSSRAKNVILQGNAPSITQIFDLKIATGREFNETDTEHHAPVVLLGFDTTNLLFPDGGRSAVGQEVTIDGQLFTVIGTLQKRRQGISGGANPEDNIALMPVTTLRKLYPNKRDLCDLRQGQRSEIRYRSGGRNSRTAAPQTQALQRKTG